MINPVTVMKLLNERKSFTENHPEFFAFILNTFGENLEEGTYIQIKVDRPDGEEVSKEICLQETDMSLLVKLREMIEQIRS